MDGLGIKLKLGITVAFMAYALSTDSFQELLSMVYR